MSWINNLKKWFWGELKPELQEPQFEKPKPIEPETTDEGLEDAVKQTVHKKRNLRVVVHPAVEKPVEKKSPTKKSKKPRKPRKPKTENKK